jgi:hypothetical protein
LHAPQLFTSVCSSSQTPLHGEYGALHAMPHVPTPLTGAHVAVPFEGAGHT